MKTGKVKNNQLLNINVGIPISYSFYSVNPLR